MARKKLASSIPRNWLVGEWLLDWNRLDTNDWTKNNWTATNVTYISTDKWYQKQAGSFNWSSSYITISNNLWLTSWWWQTISLIAKSLQSKYAYIADWQTTSWWNERLILINNANTLDIYSSWNFYATWIPITNYTHIVLTHNTNWTDTLYVNWIFIYTNISWTTWNGLNMLRIWCPADRTNTALFNWQIQSVRIYNRVLSQQEIQNLYQEWLRQLWQWSDNILSSAVAQFRSMDWNTTLSNIIWWTTETYVWWTSATDNFWITWAITNPNYTWSSITYTTWYTFENSWSGWWIVTSPSWLSATWINRTTTLREIFLMNKTLSADEVTELERLCKIKYLYPFKKTFPLNLNDWKVLHLAWDTNWSLALDISWNGNNWTMVGSFPIIRQWQHKLVKLTTSWTYIKDIPNTNLKVTTYSFSCWLYNNWSTYTDWRIFSNLSLWSANFWIDISVDRTTTHKVAIIHSIWWSSQVTSVTTTWITNSKWTLLTVTYDWTTQAIKVYFNWVLQPTTASTLWNPYTWYTNTYRIWQSVTWNSDTYVNWNISNPILWNRVLSPLEIQQLYYSTFIS